MKPSCPQRDSNPCYRLERAASWAARRWGRPRHNRTGAISGGHAPVRPRRRLAKAYASREQYAKRFTRDHDEAGWRGQCSPAGRGTRRRWRSSTRYGRRLRYAATVLLRSPPAAWDSTMAPGGTCWLTLAMTWLVMTGPGGYPATFQSLGSTSQPSEIMPRSRA